MTTKENLNLEVFSSPEFGQMRILAENGKYLFCASDAATALGYSNPRSALQRHCKGVVKRDTLAENITFPQSRWIKEATDGTERIPHRSPD